MPRVMLSIFKNLFGHRSRGFGRFGRRRSGLGRMVGNHRGMALGSLAALAAPFIMRKLRARHSGRNVAAGY